MFAFYLKIKINSMLNLQLICNKRGRPKAYIYVLTTYVEANRTKVAAMNKPIKILIYCPEAMKEYVAKTRNKRRSTELNDNQQSIGSWKEVRDLIIISGKLKCDAQGENWKQNVDYFDGFEGTPAFCYSWVFTSPNESLIAT